MLNYNYFYIHLGGHSEKYVVSYGYKLKVLDKTTVKPVDAPSWIPLKY